MSSDPDHGQKPAGGSDTGAPITQTTPELPDIRTADECWKKTPPWVDILQEECTRLRTDLSIIRQREPDSKIIGIIDHNLKTLESEISCLLKKRGLGWRRLIYWVGGVIYWVGGANSFERLWSLSLQIATDMLMVLPDDEIRGRIPALRASLKTYLGPNDIRYSDFVQLLDDIERRRAPNASGGPPPTADGSVS